MHRLCLLLLLATCGPPAGAGDEPLPPTIGTIQGRGAASPWEGRRVQVVGVVTGLHVYGSKRYHMAFVQDLPDDADGDPRTSDGLAIFLGRDDHGLRPGDLVRISGRVQEYRGLTEIDAEGLVLEIEGRGLDLPPPVVLRHDDTGDLERLEAMRVALPPDTPAFGPTSASCAFMVGVGPPEILEAGSWPPTLSLHVTATECKQLPTLRPGDRLRGSPAGPLTWGLGLWALVAQEELDVERRPPSEPPRVEPPEPPRFSIATWNLQNHFDSADDPATDDTVVSPPDLETKSLKLVHTLTVTLGCPTLLALQEVETRELVAALASRASDACGFDYRVGHADSADRRGLDVALLSDSSRFRVESVGVVPDVTFPRAPLHVSGLLDGELLDLVIVHLTADAPGKSLAARRRSQAEALAAYVRPLLERDQNARVLIAGDFNAPPSAWELEALGQAGLHDLTRVVPPSKGPWTFRYRGAPRLLDGLRASPGVERKRSADAVHILHINADHPVSMAGDTTPDGLPWRSSDHDPVVAFLCLADRCPPYLGLRHGDEP